MSFVYLSGVLVSAILLIFWPSITHPRVFGIPLQGVNKVTYLPYLTFVIGHVAAGIVVLIIRVRKRTMPYVHVVVLVVAFLSLGVLSILHFGSPYSRSVVLGAYAISIGTYTLLHPTLNAERKGTAIATLLALTLGAATVFTLALVQPAFLHDRRRSAAARGPEQKSLPEKVTTTFHELRIREFRSGLFGSKVRGGALEYLGDSFLFVTGDGNFFRLGLSDAEGDLDVESLGIKAPLNYGEFDADAPKKVNRTAFRVNDLVVQRAGDRTRLLVSHFYWKREAGCFVLRVSRFDVGGDLSSVRRGGDWETVYDTHPCMGFKERGNPFVGIVSGGRMQFLSEDELLLTVGDFQFDGWNADSALAQQDGSYGKIVRIGLRNGDAETFSRGHRNPQGLFVAPDGTIWSTEHGPKGGDELNIIVNGKNYGWPFETYGSNYGMEVWPISDRQGVHDVYERPVYAWVPSVGISNLLQMSGEEFPHWAGDLFAGSLEAETIYRVHVRENRAVLVEPIPLQRRIRDLALDSAGRLVLWTDNGVLLVVTRLKERTETSPAFVKYCAPCHQTDDDDHHAIGPDLGTVYGRFVASASGYEYSNALRGRPTAWTESALKRFISDPLGDAPGTTMQTPGLTDTTEVEEIVTYLRYLKSRN